MCLAIVCFNSCLFTKAVYKESSYVATECLNTIGAKVAILTELKSFTDILLYLENPVRPSDFHLLQNVRNSSGVHPSVLVNEFYGLLI